MKRITHQDLKESRARIIEKGFKNLQPKLDDMDVCPDCGSMIDWRVEYRGNGYNESVGYCMGCHNIWT